jgi:thiol-disulfide isomerase/thioredoxin
MAKIIEIKTPNCSRCKQFESEYQRIQAENPENTYIVLIFGKDPEAMEYANKYGIKSAPTFVIEQDGKDTIVVKQEELEQTIKSL